MDEWKLVYTKGSESSQEVQSLLHPGADVFLLHGLPTLIYYSQGCLGIWGQTPSFVLFICLQDVIMLVCTNFLMSDL